MAPRIVLELKFLVLKLCVTKEMIYKQWLTLIDSTDIVINSKSFSQWTNAFRFQWAGGNSDTYEELYVRKRTGQGEERTTKSDLKPFG